MQQRQKLNLEYEKRAQVNFKNKMQKVRIQTIVKRKGCL
jgi:hypothetical protein